MNDHSTNETVVEYAAQSMLKGQSPARAAGYAVKKLHGTQNLFIDNANTVNIDAQRLTEALWDRLVANVISALPRILATKQHYALDGVLQQFRQKTSLRPELKRRVIAVLERDPFTHDDTP